MSELVDMCGKIRNSKICFVLNPNNIWDKFESRFNGVVNGIWTEVKFLDEVTMKLHKDLRTIPNDFGGIYIFMLKPEIIPSAHLYIMYIGRAKITSGQNLRKRCCQYLYDTRPKVSYMINTWGKDLYIRYLQLDDNKLIDDLEKELINTIIPPCNDEIPDKVISKAMKSAF